ncbi:flavoprotein-like protein [Mucor mucedo]|uniref:flavoprotein-like protein n=1 Tax=Mucor mucedo TaxID=29922 RepID=UPI00221F7E44|nr:flavoprotein-like protein [Mucor mucedo]KAI7896381.1 flavoprotein-like protein [Mucor mucedo]
MAPKVYIIIYSLYHHIYTLALDVQKGLVASGIDAKIFQVPETLPEEILVKMQAPPKPDVPVITVDDLSEADGFLFGVPTRFGTMPAQIKSFLDATGGLWASGALAGKFAGTFFSTASQHGGQETTAFTLLTYFTHLGLNYVPLGFANSNLFDNSEVIGGSPYGAGTVANGDGSRQATEKELEIARTQGENFAKLLITFHRGLEVAEEEENVKKTNVVESVEAVEEAAVSVEETEAPKPVVTETVKAEEPKAEEKKSRAVAKPEAKKESKCFCM